MVPWSDTLSTPAGDTCHPDLLLSCSNGSLYVVELTTAYETNLKNNVKQKKDKYRELLRQLGKNFDQVKFINLSISSLGIFAEESIGLDKNHQMYCVRKMMTIAIRTTYYILTDCIIIISISISIGISCIINIINIRINSITSISISISTTILEKISVDFSKNTPKFENMIKM
jgi:hypothetical protein